MNQYKSIANSLVKGISKSINTMSGVSQLPPGMKKMNRPMPDNQIKASRQEVDRSVDKSIPSVRRNRPNQRQRSSQDEPRHIHKADMYNQVEASNDTAYQDRDKKGVEKYKDLKGGAYNRKHLDAFGVQKPKKKVRHPIFNGVSKSELKRGIIFSEVLGKPKSLQ